ncbi:PerC family transcriptional regulator [Escherichia coli]|nr:PerC family transcriptional regulator [Escherichia coli]ELN8235183.1 PerC family transcriptional regulator [Escherichia coli]
MDGSLIQLNKILVDEFLSTQKRALEAVDDLIALKLEAAGCWRRASARWLVVMGAGDITDAQREWLLRRRAYCMAQTTSHVLNEKMNIRGVAKAADETLKRMGIAELSEEMFRKRPSYY